MTLFLSRSASTLLRKVCLYGDFCVEKYLCRRWTTNDESSAALCSRIHSMSTHTPRSFSLSLLSPLNSCDLRAACAWSPLASHCNGRIVVVVVVDCANRNYLARNLGRTSAGKASGHGTSQKGAWFARVRTHYMSIFVLHEKFQKCKRHRWCTNENG
jgi:hypothetical protein